MSGLGVIGFESSPKDRSGCRVGVDRDHLGEGIDKALGWQAPASAGAQENEPRGLWLGTKGKHRPPIGEKAVNSFCEIAPKAFVPKQGLGMPN